MAEPFLYSKSERMLMKELRINYKMKDAEILRECLRLTGWIYTNLTILPSESLSGDCVAAIENNSLIDNEISKMLTLLKTTIDETRGLNVATQHELGKKQKVEDV